jgi:hypothetical protein
MKEQPMIDVKPIKEQHKVDIATKDDFRVHCTTERKFDTHVEEVWWGGTAENVCYTRI